MRESGMPDGVQPVAQSETPNMIKSANKLSHIVAISMDARGWPRGLFTTNRWVTSEYWHRADDVCAMLDRFDIDHTWPSWATNRWVSAMLRLFRPQIVRLLRERDVVVANWQEKHTDKDVFEDRQLDSPSHVEISLDRQIRIVQAALDAHGGEPARACIKAGFRSPPAPDP
jgi:hypothetical protein